ncbi:hypothetical protein [Sphingomonas xinjiangensis]|nr:hypothetical protein [Sphingomonas xinjiangensis]
MFSNLYSRGGCEQAIKIGLELAADAELNKSGRLWLYMAAAYGQQHAALVRAGNADDAALASSRNRALEAVRNAVSLDPAENLPAFRMLYDRTDTARPRGESDLVIFFGDPDFDRILLPPSHGDAI